MSETTITALRAAIEQLPRFYGPYSEMETVKVADVLRLLDEHEARAQARRRRNLPSPYDCSGRRG